MADMPEVFTSADPDAASSVAPSTVASHSQDTAETFTSADPASTASAQSSSTPSSSVGQNVLDYITGRTTGEALGHLVSGAAGGIAGDLAGLESSVLNRMAASSGPITSGIGKLGQSVISYITGTSDNNPDTIKSTVANALTYEPSSAGGKAVEHGIDTILSPVGTAINYGEGKLGDLTSGIAGGLGASPAAQADIKSGTQDAADAALSIIPGDKLIGGAAAGVKDAATKFANSRAFAAMGGNKTVMNGLSGSDKIASANAAGRAALDNGVITPSGSVDTMTQRTEALKDQAIKKQTAATDNAQDIIDKVNAASPQSGVAIGQPDAEALSESIKNKYAPILKGVDFSTSAARNAIQQVLDYFDKKTPDTIVPGTPEVPGVAGTPGTPDLYLPADNPSLTSYHSPGEGIMLGEPGTPDIPAVPGTPDTVIPGGPVANNGQPFTFPGIQKLKNKISEGTDWKSDTIGAAKMQEIWHQLDDYLESGLKSSTAIGETLAKYPQFNIDPASLANHVQDWLAAKKDYQNASNMQSALEDKAQRDQAKKVANFSDMLFALGGGLAGGPIGAIKSLAAKRAVQQFGNPLLALGADAVSKGADKLSNITPIGASALQTGTVQGGNTQQRDEFSNEVPTLEELLKQNPQAFGKYAAPLQDAANRGPDRLAATMYMLGTSDPQYRAITNGLLDNYNARQ